MAAPEPSTTKYDIARKSHDASAMPHDPMRVDATAQHRAE